MPQDLRGQRFGELQVTGIANRDKYYAARWWCVCSCGRVTAVKPHPLLTGHTVSCGCKVGNTTNHKLKHGHNRDGAGQSPTRTYRSWQGMNYRCCNRKASNYSKYGGAGITVCERWTGDNGFANFLLDMGERPAGKTLDRFPNRAGNYEPSNCRWATLEEQSQNLKTTRLSLARAKQIRWLHQGGLSQSEIAKIFDVSRSSIGDVVHDLSWKNA